MIIGVLNEQNDNRVAIVPKLITKFKKTLQCDIYVEEGAGLQAFYSDTDYTNVGAIITSRAEVLNNVKALVTLLPPSDEDLKALPPQAIVISLFAPYMDSSIVEHLKGFDIVPFSMDMIPRTTLAQSMDVLSSMASIAGYKAVLTAANHLPHYFPMLITAAGSIKPSTVVILGAGVAGLQAIATARRLGAVVEVSDPRRATKEEVLSLGGKFIEVEGAADDKDAGGYAVAQTEEYLKKQRILVQERAMKANIIITTAQVRGRKAPLLIPTSTVEKMKKGSVIVDLAASTGGNCALTQDGKTIVHKGVTIIGDSNLAAKMPSDSSFLFSNNVLNFMKLFIKEGKVAIDMEHEIVGAACLNAPK